MPLFLHKRIFQLCVGLISSFEIVLAYNSLWAHAVKVVMVVAMVTMARIFPSLHQLVAEICSILRILQEGKFFSGADIVEFFQKIDKLKFSLNMGQIAHPDGKLPLVFELELCSFLNIFYDKN